MRQVRRAQARRCARGAPWLLTDAGAAGRGVARRDRRHRHRARGRASISSAERALDRPYLRGRPLGNLMMRFRATPDPARVIKDLQRLLRASGFG